MEVLKANLLVIRDELKEFRADINDFRMEMRAEIGRLDMKMDTTFSRLDHGIQTAATHLDLDFKSAFARLDETIKAAVSEIRAEIRAAGATIENALDAHSTRTHQLLHEIREENRYISNRLDKIATNLSTINSKLNALFWFLGGLVAVLCLASKPGWT